MAHIPVEAHVAHQRMRVRGGARCRDHRHDALSEPQFRASSTKTEKKKNHQILQALRLLALLASAPSTEVKRDLV